MSRPLSSSPLALRRRAWRAEAAARDAALDASAAALAPGLAPGERAARQEAARAAWAAVREAEHAVAAAYGRAPVGPLPPRP